MSKTYCLRFDTGNAAFVDYGGRNIEIASVIRRVVQGIEARSHLDDIKAWDTNGNTIGSFSEVTSVEKAADGEVVLVIDTGNAAFDDAPEGEVVRILRAAASRIEVGDWPAGLLDINGNRVGNLVDNYVEPPVEVPDDVARKSLQELRLRPHPASALVGTPEALGALATEMELETFGQTWTAAYIERDPDGGVESAFVTADPDPAVSFKSFVQIARNGLTEDWAEQHEAVLNGDPPPPGYR